MIAPTPHPPPFPPRYGHAMTLNAAPALLLYSFPQGSGPRLLPLDVLQLRRERRPQGMRKTTRCRTYAYINRKVSSRAIREQEYRSSKSKTNKNTERKRSRPEQSKVNAAGTTTLHSLYLCPIPFVSPSHGREPGGATGLVLRGRGPHRSRRGNRERRTALMACLSPPLKHPPLTGFCRGRRESGANVSSCAALTGPALLSDAPAICPSAPAPPPTTVAQLVSDHLQNSLGACVLFPHFSLLFSPFIIASFVFLFQGRNDPALPHAQAHGYGRALAADQRLPSEKGGKNLLLFLSTFRGECLVLTLTYIFYYSPPPPPIPPHFLIRACSIPPLPSFCFTPNASTNKPPFFLL